MQSQIHYGYVSFAASRSIEKNYTLPAGSKIDIHDRTNWVMSGVGSTNLKGQDEIDLKRILNYWRNSQAEEWRDWIPSIIHSRVRVLLTPAATSPVFMTSIAECEPSQKKLSFRRPGDYEEIEGTHHAYDVKVKTRSWNADGEPARQVDYSWLAIAEAGLYFYPE